MSSPPTHTLHRFSARLLEVLDEIGDPALWSMTADELTETISNLTTGANRLQGLALSGIAHAEATDVASSLGAVNTAAMLRSLLHESGPGATRMVKLAKALEAHPACRAQLLAGHVTVDQTREITTAVDALPDEVGVADRSRAEAHLLREALTHDPIALRRLGKHLVDVLDPDGADARLAAALDKEERQATKKAFLKIYDNGQGSLEFSGRIPLLHGSMFTKILQAFLNPGRPDPINPGLPRDQARGLAFCQLLERCNPDKLPTTGGMNATVVVTMTLETLLGGLVAAHLDTGHPISPTMARKLACQAGIIPAVLGTRSEVLDLGRTARFHSNKQRLALNIQQRGVCAVEHCDRPASWADAHHLDPWATGGETSVHDGVLICPRHHTLAHDHRHELQRIAPGRVRLVRRQ